MAADSSVSPPHRNLTRTSRLMAWLALAGAVLLPLMVIHGFVAPSQHANFVTRFEGFGHLLTPDVPLRDRILALAFQLIPAGLKVLALLALRDLFNRYAEGEMFSLSSVAALRRVAKYLFLAVIAGFVVQAGTSFALTLSNPPGEHLIVVGLSSAMIGNIFWAGVMMVIAWAMCEARNLADENASIV
jgi:hypothetical protein